MISMKSKAILSDRILSMSSVIHDDIRKIKEYKGLISELKAMNSQLLDQLKSNSTEVPTKSL